MRGGPTSPLTIAEAAKLLRLRNGGCAGVTVERVCRGYGLDEDSAERAIKLAERGRR